MKNKILIFLVSSFFTVFSFGKSANTDKYQKLINKHSSDIQKCRESATNETFMVSGKVFVNLEIDDTAYISKIKIDDELTTLKDLNLQKCVVDTIKKIKFPKAPKGQMVSIAHTAIFK